MSSRDEVMPEIVVHLACDEPFQTPQYVFLGEPLSEPALHVVDCSGVVSEPNYRDHVQRTVCFPISSAVEPHPMAFA